MYDANEPVDEFAQVVDLVRLVGLGDETRAVGQAHLDLCDRCGLVDGQLLFGRLLVGLLVVRIGGARHNGGRRTAELVAVVEEDVLGLGRHELLLAVILHVQVDFAALGLAQQLAWRLAALNALQELAILRVCVQAQHAVVHVEAVLPQLERSHLLEKKSTHLTQVDLHLLL